MIRTPPLPFNQHVIQTNEKQTHTIYTLVLYIRGHELGIVMRTASLSNDTIDSAI